MSSSPVACASAVANEVLPTPASPSRNTGLPRRSARYPAVASPASDRYPAPARASARAVGDSMAGTRPLWRALRVAASRRDVQVGVVGDVLTGHAPHLGPVRG